MDEQFLYRAFISYSHRDEKWAAWLHKALESFRVPRRLVGTQGAFGQVPARLAPVFIDREELTVSTNLSDNIKQALSQSESLIVVCSPEARSSRWVNEEVREFQRLGRHDRIYCLIVDGDPQAPDPDDRCFPSALLESETGGPTTEPLAADARDFADGKILARQKIVASLLGLRLDELRQREKQRQRKLVLAASVLVGLFVATAGTAIVSKRAEKIRMAHAETLVAQMLEVSDQLEKTADLETLKSISQRLAGYLETIDSKNLSDESSIQISNILTRLGSVSRLQGQPNEAMEAFTRAKQILSEVTTRSPENQTALFELGQTEFWIGYLNSDRGNAELAEEGFINYLSISERLYAAEPENAEWAMEMAYALSNLGVLEQSRPNKDKQKILGHLTEAMRYNERAVELAPDDTYYQMEMADSYANLGDAWLEVCDLQAALDARKNSVEYARIFYLNEPSNKRQKENYAYALSGLALVHRSLGEISDAAEQMQESVRLLEELSHADPSNKKFRHELLNKKTTLAQLLTFNGEPDPAWDIVREIESEYREITDTHDGVNVDQTSDYVNYLLAYSNLAWRRGATELSAELLLDARDTVTRLQTRFPDSAQIMRQVYNTNFQWWEQNGRQQDDTVIEVLARYSDASHIEETDMSCTGANLSSRMFLMQGETDIARQYSQYLLQNYYLDPDFIRFCRESSLCEPDAVIQTTTE